MPALARKTPLKLLPAIAAGARQRARMLAQPLSAYVTILLWNHAQSPRPLAAEPAEVKHAREHVPCTIRRTVWLAAVPHIKASGLSANAFVEALIARDLRSDVAPLAILPARGSAKPRLD